MDNLIQFQYSQIAFPLEIKGRGAKIVNEVIENECR